MDAAPLIAQLEGIVAEYEAMVRKSQFKDLSDLPKPDRQALVTRAVAAIRRIAGPGSIYDQDAHRQLQASSVLHVHTSPIIGVTKALLFDLKAGHLQSVIELVHAEMFDDFMEMSSHLLQAGYKDAAAVIAGSTLEAHLRALCTKHNVSPTTSKPDGTVVPKKAESMNSELCAANAYNKLDQKSVTSWLDLRNKAAHGKYTEYTKEQVALALDAIRAFISRVSA